MFFIDVPSAAQLFERNKLAGLGFFFGRRPAQLFLHYYVKTKISIALGARAQIK